jgi:hypothetical protein
MTDKGFYSDRSIAAGPWWSRCCAAAALLVMAASCTDTAPPGEPDAALLADAASMSADAAFVPADAIIITQMQVLDEVDGWGLLEVEVHMMDANGILIGCSGDYHGLRAVDEQDVLYSGLMAHFVPPDAPPLQDAPPDMWITLADIQDKDIRLMVIEDDAEPCPTPVGEYDDIIATSELFSGATLATLSTLSFGDVPVLTIGVRP